MKVAGEILNKSPVLASSSYLASADLLKHAGVGDAGLVQGYGVEAL